MNVVLARKLRSAALNNSDCKIVEDGSDSVHAEYEIVNVDSDSDSTVV